MIPHLPSPFWSGYCQFTATIRKETALARKRCSPLKAAKEKKAATCGIGCASCAFSYIYTLDGPASYIGSISLVTIRRHYLHCMRIIDVYGATYGVKERVFTGRFLESRGGNTKLRAGMEWGVWSRFLLRERRDQSVSYPNLFTIIHDHSDFRFR